MMKGRRVIGAKDSEYERGYNNGYRAGRRAAQVGPNTKRMRVIKWSCLGCGRTGTAVAIPSEDQKRATISHAAQTKPHGHRKALCVKPNLVTWVRPSAGGDVQGAGSTTKHCG